MKFVSPTTLHIIDKRTGRVLCYTRDPQLVPKIREELGVEITVRQEWQLRLQRLMRRFEVARQTVKAPLDDALERPRVDPLSGPLPETQRERLNEVTVRPTPGIH